MEEGVESFDSFYLNQLCRERGIEESEDLEQLKSQLLLWAEVATSPKQGKTPYELLVFCNVLQQVEEKLVMEISPEEQQQSVLIEEEKESKK